jgi:Mg2+ and Co2+ transporter CorA
LVREFLACIDELAALRAIINKKLDFLERLAKDCEAFDAEDEARGEKPNPNSYDESVSWTSRTRFAASSLKRASDHYERLLNDLNNSLNSVSSPLLFEVERNANSSTSYFNFDR